MGVPRLTRAAAALLLAACSAPASSDRVAVSSFGLRPDAPAAREMPPAFGAGDQVERFDSEGGSFRVHFTRAGQHAVPRDNRGGNGTPDFVEEVAAEYEAVLAFYREELGFRAPLGDDAADNNGGDGRFDVYLLDFPNSADGAYKREDCLAAAPRRCSGFMLHENDFVGRSYPSRLIATRVLASHELFHAVQSAHDAEAGVVIGEGTAVWASEAYDASLSDFEGFVAGYLDRPERSLAQEPGGPVDPFTYGSALFFRYLEERWERPLIRELWEALVDREPSDADGEPAWPAALDTLLAQRDSSLADAYAEFATWNLYTGRRADARAAYARGADYPTVAERAVALPYRDGLLRVFPLSARYYVAEAGATDAIRLEAFAADGDELEGLRLLLAREAGGRIVEAHAAEGAVELEELAAGERVHAVVLNTKLAGESLQPALCFGERAAVAACRAELEGGPTPDAAVAPDGGAANEPAASSGCAIAAASPQRVPVWMLLLLIAALLRKRARSPDAD